MRQKSIAADVPTATMSTTSTTSTAAVDPETSATIDIWDILAKMVHVYSMTPDQLLDLPSTYFLQLLNKMSMVESNEALCLVTHLMRAIFGDSNSDSSDGGNNNDRQPKNAQAGTVYVNTPDELRSALAALGGI